MLKLTMSLAYRIVFECPKDHKNINLQKKCSNSSLSESDAMKMFGNEEIACTNPACGWHGKARRTRLLRILPFDWVLAPATREAVCASTESRNAVPTRRNMPKASAIKEFEVASCDLKTSPHTTSSDGFGNWKHYENRPTLIRRAHF
jgi:hypothetical protein